MFNIIPSWLPTREDQIKNRKEQVTHAKKELPEVFNRMNDSTNEYLQLLNELEKTMSKEQMEIWLQVKNLAQEASFNSGRYKALQDIIGQDFTTYP